MSARLAEFSAYYSNRMSYDEVAGLLERVTGARVLSDQTIQHLVVTKATQVSAQWQAEVQADPDAPTLSEVVPQVDWYDAHSEEVLVLTDAIQVKQQKARRGKEADSPEEEQACKRVSTDVWLVEKATGGFAYVTAGIAAPGEDGVSATARVQWQLQQNHCGQDGPIPVVVITVSAKTISYHLEVLFTH